MPPSPPLPPPFLTYSLQRNHADRGDQQVRTERQGGTETKKETVTETETGTGTEIGTEKKTETKTETETRKEGGREE